MQNDMPSDSDNPWINHHRHIAREAEKKAVEDEITARNARADRKLKAIMAPKPQPKAYIPDNPFRR